MCKREEESGEKWVGSASFVVARAPASPSSAGRGRGGQDGCLIGPIRTYVIASAPAMRIASDLKALLFSAAAVLTLRTMSSSSVGAGSRCGRSSPIVRFGSGLGAYFGGAERAGRLAARRNEVNERRRVWVERG